MSEKAPIQRAGGGRKLAAAISGLCLVGAAGGILYAGVTRDFGTGVKFFFGSLCAFFASASAVTFLTGEFRVRGAFAISRARNPAAFYFVAILATLLTVGPLSWLLWLALRRMA